MPRPWFLSSGSSGGYQGSLEKWLILRSGQGIYLMSLENLRVFESKRSAPVKVCHDRGDSLASKLFCDQSRKKIKDVTLNYNLEHEYP